MMVDGINRRVRQGLVDRLTAGGLAACRACST
jgi:hypothetical protein